MNQQVDTLKKYGYSYQIKTIASLFDVTFLNRITDILVPEYFESESNQWLIKTIQTYFAKYKTTITIDAIKLRLRSDESITDVLKTTIESTIKDIVAQIDASDIAAVKDDFLLFCQNQKVKLALIDSYQLLKSGRYDSIREIITTAFKAGMDQDIGLDTSEDLDKIFDEAARFPYKLPWDALNDITDGGIGPGELAVYVAGPGGGKTTTLINIAAEAVKAGKTVIYYTLELSKGYIGAKYLSYISGIPVNSIKNHREEVRKANAALKGKMIIQHYSTRRATLATLEAHMEKCKALGKKPDLICIDYIDLLKYQVSKTKRNDQELGDLYADTRGLAGDWQVPIHSGSQAGRSAEEQEIIQGNKIAEAYSKIMVADLVISLARKTTDKLAGTGRIHIIKNRFGIDGITLPSKLIMNTCRIDIYSADSMQGKNTTQQMASGETLLRKNISSRYKDLMKVEEED